MNELGARIKALRKEKKLTLEMLAGDKMSKGMMSLIENGKAQPSMESLQHIAKQLQVEVAELIGDGQAKFRRDLLKRAESLYETPSSYELPNYLGLIELIQPHLEKLSLNYESAKLEEYYAKACFHLKKEEWEVFYLSAKHKYEKLHLYSSYASLLLMRAMVEFQLHHYEDALTLAIKEYESFEEKTIVLDPMTKLDYLYIISVLNSAIGQDDKADLWMEEAIAYAIEKRVFYRIDDLYRLACFRAMMNGEEDKRRYYIEKLRLYADFTERKDSHEYALIMNAHFYTTFEENPEMAWSYLENFPETDDSNDFYMLEMAKYRNLTGEYTTSLELLKQVTISSNIHHPYDLSMMYDKYRVQALNEMGLGNHENALMAIEQGLKANEGIPETVYVKKLMKLQKEIESESR
ncbi:helix-turn-helix domain-containing protein [Paenisporosarcina cavernae]|uniref:XRE family transcriptional regulator n=1 Tax=Paenisporosarcina cavernae TaxID=2320858 RepID=A0A385YU40_9BACL|nr:helix-turn-helix transcriptional regulator [Paenisporosarcina cavernae]AYC30379.1 XRE family transcriptional regulator [Paenisporosarcina cavernae]